MEVTVAIPFFCPVGPFNGRTSFAVQFMASVPLPRPIRMRDDIHLIDGFLSGLHCQSPGWICGRDFRRFLHPTTRNAEEGVSVDPAASWRQGKNALWRQFAAVGAPSMNCDEAGTDQTACTVTTSQFA
jgi:hypothetical protein